MIILYIWPILKFFYIFFLKSNIKRLPTTLTCSRKFGKHALISHHASGPLSHRGRRILPLQVHFSRGNFTTKNFTQPSPSLKFNSLRIKKTASCFLHMDHGLAQNQLQEKSEALITSRPTELVSHEKTSDKYQTSAPDSPAKKTISWKSLEPEGTCFALRRSVSLMKPSVWWWWAVCVGCSRWIGGNRRRKSTVVFYFLLFRQTQIKGT